MPETVFSKDAPDSNQNTLSYATPLLARLKVLQPTHTSMEWCALAVGRPGLNGRRQWALARGAAEALIESAVLPCCRASATTREAAQILVAPNGADLLIRSQLYQQTGGADWLPTPV